MRPIGHRIPESRRTHDGRGSECIEDSAAAGLNVIALRIAILRVRGVGVQKKLPFSSLTSMEKFQFGRAWFATAEFSRALVHGTVQRVTMDGGATGLHEQMWWALERTDSAFSKRVL